MRRTQDEEEKRQPLPGESGNDRRRAFDALYSTAEHAESSVSPSAPVRKTLPTGTDMQAALAFKSNRVSTIP
jgi:hypothetical protein